MTDMSMILGRIGRKLATDVVPKLEGDYAGGQAGMAAMMASIAGELLDGEADRLFREIADLRALLQGGGVVVQVPDAPSLKVSELTAERDALARLLIGLQTQLETRQDDAAKALNAQIWHHLLATATARMPSPPDFSAGDAG